MNDLRFGVLGTGGIGAVHVRAIDGVAGATLVAVADVPDRLSAAQALASAHGAIAYAGLDQMLAADDVDAVSICTPSGLHAEQAIRVMRSGRHALVEKPMAMTTKDADEMIQVQREIGVKLAVVSQHRFDPAATLVRSLVDQTAFGRLCLGLAHVPWWREQAYYESGEWRGTAALDGGVLMNQAIHLIDLLQWLMGPVRAVQGFADTLAHRMEAEDTAVAVLRFEEGALGTISATTGAFPELSTRLEILGDRGSAVIDDGHLTVLRVKDREIDTAGMGEKPRFGDSHARQIADLVDSIRVGRSPLVDGAEGRKPVAIIGAILQAAGTLTPVDVA